MFGIGRLEELLVVLAIVFLLFGGKKLPELSRGFADAIREIRKGFKDDISEKEEKPSSSPATELTPNIASDTDPQQKPIMQVVEVKE